MSVQIIRLANFFPLIVYNFVKYYIIIYIVIAVFVVSNINSVLLIYLSSNVMNVYFINKTKASR